MSLTQPTKSAWLLLAQRGIRVRGTKHSHTCGTEGRAQCPMLSSHREAEEKTERQQVCHDATGKAQRHLQFPSQEKAMAFFQHGAEQAHCRDRAATGQVGAQPPQPSQVACQQGTSAGEYRLEPNAPMKAGKLMAAAHRGCAPCAWPLAPCLPSDLHPPTLSCCSQAGGHDTKGPVICA